MGREAVIAAQALATTWVIVMPGRWILIVISGPCGDKIGHGMRGRGGKRPAGCGFGRSRIWQFSEMGEQSACHAGAIGVRVAKFERWLPGHRFLLFRGACRAAAGDSGRTQGRARCESGHTGVGEPSDSAQQIVKHDAAPSPIVVADRNPPRMPERCIPAVDRTVSIDGS
ncbi:hypothetical protein BLA17378_08436 [Burkholderia aenigmatica]|uniref:Uncharacterized protein n=1 Tax=Burkholderia aenigmatica TaxID=2015348 RepID=A0ABY6Y8M5_9BURK|nr:hypothetical protein BLA17378_08436 [Burkholderia aenigmatica]